MLQLHYGGLRVCLVSSKWFKVSQQDVQEGQSTCGVSCPIGATVVVVFEFCGNALSDSFGVRYVSMGFDGKKRSSEWLGSLS